MTVLALCLLAAAFMTGLSWLISVVHYPLFAVVGSEAFGAYHAAHTRRITPVVIPPMLTELVTSALLLADRPAGVSAPAAAVGFALALATWAVTGLASAPDHGRLARGFDPRVHRRLVRGNHVRTLLWSAHAVLLTVLIA